MMVLEDEEQCVLGHVVSVLITLLSASTIYYLVRVVHAPVFVHSSGKWGVFLKENMSVIHRKYWPTPWCYESRFQTIFGSLVRSHLLPKQIDYQRDILVMPDKGEVSLDWLYPENEQFSLICVFLPGLTGDSQVEYIRPMVLIAQQQGAAAVVLNNRGKAGLHLKNQRTYCAANCEDFREAMIFIRKKHPDKKIMGTGTSLGSMILGHYLRTEGVNADMVCGFMISTLFQPNEGMKNLEKGFINVHLAKYLTFGLHDTVRQFHKELVSDKWDLEHIYQCRTLREFDRRFTAPNFGYPSLEAYYEAASLDKKMDQIKIPVLCLSAADDPFQLHHLLPIEAIQNECSSVAMLVTERGGHIGFLEGAVPRLGRLYLEVVFKELLIATMNNLQYVIDLKSTS